MEFCRRRNWALALVAGLLMTGQAYAQEDDQIYGMAWGTGEITCDRSLEADRHAADPSYRRSALWDQLVLGTTNGVCPGTLRPLDDGTWGESAPFTGTDKAGRRAEFRLYVLHDRFFWESGSASELLDKGAPVDLAPVLKTPQFHQRFCAAKAVVSTGAASSDGPTALNHKLAEARARHVTGKLSDTRASCRTGQVPILFSVNLGENQSPLADARAAAQRRVVIVAAENLAIGVNLEQALRQGLETQDVFREVSLDDYDLFEVAAF